MKKLIFAAGMAAGYVLGARAGRKRYEQIRTTAQNLWDTDPVQRSVQGAQDFAKDHIGDVADTVYTGAKKVIDTVVSKGAQRSDQGGQAGQAGQSRPSGNSTQSDQSGQSTHIPKATQKATPGSTAENSDSGSS